MSEIVFRKSAVSPSTPGFDEVSVFVKAADACLYMKDGNGVETRIQGGANYFTELKDVPSNYAAGKYIAVKSDGSGLEFVDGTDGGGTFASLTDTPHSYSGQAGKFLAVNGNEDGLTFVDAPSGGGTGDVKKFEFFINFGASNPQSISELPSGWNTSISSADVTVVHTVGRPPVSIHYYGLGTLNGQPTWRYRLPSAANEMIVSDATRNSEFTFRINTSVAAADTNSQARIVVLF